MTWNTPFLFRTRPQGSRLLVCGPVNAFRETAQPLTALIESDWMSMSFTMNWKVLRRGERVRFEAGEPLFQVVPLLNDPCADLESASVTYQKLGDDPGLSRSYREWDEGRRRFHQGKEVGEVSPNDWQKDYFHGHEAGGTLAAVGHMIRIKSPRVRFSPSTTDFGDDGRPRTRTPPDSSPGQATPRHDAGQSPLQTPAPDANSSLGLLPATNAVVRVDDEWRRWIAENLMLGATPEAVLRGLTDSGVVPGEAVREVELAASSPYFRGSERLRNRLRKRDWLLSAYRKVNRLHPNSGEIRAANGSRDSTSCTTFTPPTARSSLRG